MAKAPIDYVSKISGRNIDGLRRLWRQVKARRTPGWAPGKAFEHLILRAFEIEGCQITWPYAVNLGDQVVEQIDGMISIENLKCMVEAKDYDSPINAEPVAKLRNQLLRRPAGVLGCIFSSSGFTAPASILATYSAPQAILLWSGDEIETLLETGQFVRALKTKYHRLVQDGVPDFDIRVGALP